MWATMSIAGVAAETAGARKRARVRCPREVSRTDPITDGAGSGGRGAARGKVPPAVGARGRSPGPGPPPVEAGADDAPTAAAAVASRVVPEVPYR